MPSRRSCIEPVRTCTQSPPRRPMVMPTVINRNAALATPALESKSTLRRNAAQSPLPTSSIIAVAPPMASTTAAGPNRRCRIASSTSSVAITSAAVQPLAHGRVDGSAASVSCGSSTRSRPGTTNNDTASRATVTTARCTCTLTSARLTSTVMTPPVTPPRLHRPCSRFITGVRRRELSTEPCTFIAHVDEHVEEQQADRGRRRASPARWRTRRSAANRST